MQKTKVDMVNRGQNYIGDVVDSGLEQIVSEGRMTATSDFAFVRDVDFIAICVPTPLDVHQQPDISYVRSSAEMIAKYLKRQSIVVLESTTYPGTTEELLRPILEAGSGLVCGKDFYLGFSPERVDPGNLIYKTKNTPKVVGGIGKEATEVIAAVYRAVLESDVTEYLAKQIESFVSTIEGVGKVKALVYVDSSFSIVAAADSEKNNTHTTEKDSQGGTRDTENATDKQTHVIIKNKDGSESVVVLQENCPALKGIAISAQGADSSVIQEKIKNALIALYGLPAHKIDVVGMK